MKTVLFLGAGFSAPFKQPTMAGFLEEVARTERLGTDDKTFIEHLVLEARRANSILESSPTNLEDILSFAVMGDRLGLLGEDEEPRGPRVKSIIRRVYSSAPSPAEYWKRYEEKNVAGLLERFIGKKDQWRESLEIITTNYDLNIESALYFCKVRASYGVELTPCEEKNGCSFSGSLVSTGGIPVFKLHGSVNWFKKEDDPDKVFMETRILSLVELQTLPYACFPDYRADGVPLIIPPSFLKPDLDSPLPEVWQGAAKALNSAEMVVFIGYSFPPSDIEMKFFFASSLADNPKLRKIVVVDPNAEKIVERLRGRESGFGSHFKAFLEPREGKWER